MFVVMGLGSRDKLLPLRERAENFGLVRKSMRPKLERKSFFTPEGKARAKRTELYIFFGIHTANVVQLADRIEQRARLAAA